MSAAALLHCSFGAWHGRYAALAPPSAVIALPEAMAAFLLEDGVTLGDASDAVGACGARMRPWRRRAKGGDRMQPGSPACTRMRPLAPHLQTRPLPSPPIPRPQMPRRGAARATGIIDSDDYRSEFFSSDGDGSGSADDEAAPPAAPWPQRFPELHAEIEAAIARLGGAVAPKLNWSAPTDALWVSPGNSLRCTSAEQVVLLLKSSDRVAFDLELLGQLRGGRAAAEARAAACAPAGAELVLRRWFDVRPELEFRCFVHGHEPVGICQRDPSQHFPQLQGAEEQRRLKVAICRFHADHLRETFVRGSCESYDARVQRRRRGGDRWPWSWGGLSVDRSSPFRLPSRSPLTLPIPSPPPPNYRRP
jgi:hypothetical protein